ncbi:terminase, partial [Micromonospora fluostatini]
MPRHTISGDGDPVGSPYPSPLIVCLGTAEDQTDNTWRPLLSMIRGGPLIDLPGMDAGQTRVELPSGGKIEPVTTSARARLGAPMTFVTLTESHLFTLQGGFRKVAGAVKRNVAGMDGRWLELTNAWDPTEGSEAQVTAEAGDERVHVDTVEPQRVESLTDDEALYAELLRQYGDSARERGGWVNIRGRIFHEVRSARHMESDRRRFFLNEIVVGQAALADPTHWDLQARVDQLRPGDRIALGFDGSRNRDATALIAARLSDGRLFQLGVWESPKGGDRDWRVDRVEVDRRVREAFGAYQVVLMYADPYRWQDYLDLWSADFGDRVLEFPTNVEQR